MMRLLAALLLLPGLALAAQAPDTPVVTGPNNAQVPIGNLLITPPGGTQQKLGDALAVTIPGGTIFPGLINLKGTGTSGQYDAQISVTGGGTIPDAGELKFTSDWQHFFTYDGTEQFRVGNIPSAAEFWQAQGGLTGNGAAFYATNGTTTGNVDGNFITQGTGSFWFGDYNGTGLKIADGGGLTNGTYWTVTPGLSLAVPPKLASSEDGQIDAANGKSVILSTNGQVHVKATNLDGGATLVNFWQFSGGAAGQFLRLYNAGTDSSINAFIKTKGSGSFTFANDNAGNLVSYNASQAGTAVSAPAFRASSTTDPVRLFSGDNIAIGGPAGGGQLATTATVGYIMIPTMAGAPTGVPTKLTAGLPIVFDTVNLKLCIYSGGAWKCSGAFS